MRRTMDEKALEEAISSHQSWLEDPDKGTRLDLRNVNLTGVVISNACLRGALFDNACMKEAYITKTDLSETSFKNTNLIGAYINKCIFDKAELKHVQMEGVWLMESSLKNANLEYANLHKVAAHSSNFSGACFLETDIREGNFSGSDFKEAIFDGVLFDKAYLAAANNLPELPFSCPEEGSFIGWKRISDNYLVKLLIPEDSPRNSDSYGLCRAKKARVLGFETVEGKTLSASEIRGCDGLLYKEGQTVSSKNFDPNRWNRWGEGITFYAEKYSAIYVLE